MATGRLGRRWGTGHVRDKPLDRSPRFRTRGRKMIWSVGSPVFGGRSPVFGGISSMVTRQTRVDDMLGDYPLGSVASLFLSSGPSLTLRQRLRPDQPGYVQPRMRLAPRLDFPSDTRRRHRRTASAGPRLCGHVSQVSHSTFTGENNYAL